MVIFIASFFSLYSFFGVDACLDVGGSAQNLGFKCDGAAPLYETATFTFWILIVLLSAFLARMCTKVFVMLKNRF